MNKYFIYKINVLNEFYIGSTKNPVHRMSAHKRDSKKEEKKNFKLYKKMNEVYDLSDSNLFNYEILESFYCEPNQVKIKEQEYINNLKPSLNMNKAFLSHEEKLEYRKNYYKIKKEKETPEEKQKRLEKKKEWYEKNKPLVKAQERERHKNKLIKELKEKLKKMEENIKLMESCEINLELDLEEINLS